MKAREQPRNNAEQDAKGHGKKQLKHMLLFLRRLKKVLKKEGDIAKAVLKLKK
jgi:hypothetical protein